MPSCIKCHKPLPDTGGSFCPFCGAKQVRSQHTRQRGNGSGTAFRRGSAWKAVAVVGWYVGDDGKAHKVTRSKDGFKTKQAALAYIPNLKGEVQKKHTLADYWKLCSEKELPTLSRKKQQCYDMAFRRLKSIAYMDIADITVGKLQEVVDAQCKTYHTAHDVTVLLNKLYALADADGVANPRLPKYIKVPEREDHQRQPFTQYEIASLWEHYEQGDHECGYVLLMIYSGMMPGELIRLRPEMIDYEAHTITGAGLKTKVRRKTPIALSDIILPVVADLQQYGKHGYFLPYREKAFREHFPLILKRAGCRPLTPYSCRHTTATALAIGENVAPQVVRRVMRWASTAMLEVYAHPSADDALRAVNMMGKGSKK